jgi:hypothetical protein
MRRENLAIGLATKLLRVDGLAPNSAKRRQGTVAKLLSILFISVTALPAQAVATSREQVVKIVRQIQRADYEGDRASLKRLYEELTPAGQSTKLASRVRYWSCSAKSAERFTTPINLW